MAGKKRLKPRKRTIFFLLMLAILVIALVPSMYYANKYYYEKEQRAQLFVDEDMDFIKEKLLQIQQKKINELETELDENKTPKSQLINLSHAIDPILSTDYVATSDKVIEPVDLGQPWTQEEIERGMLLYSKTWTPEKYGFHEEITYIKNYDKRMQDILKQAQINPQIDCYEIDDVCRDIVAHKCVSSGSENWLWKAGKKYSPWGDYVRVFEAYNDPSGETLAVFKAFYCTPIG